jgi:SPP1 gp7 family putative phage head morphogenesis protein
MFTTFSKSVSSVVSVVSVLLLLLLTMPTDATNLQDFNAANAWLQSRVTVPTGLTSAQLALAPDFAPQVRMHAFFSAQQTQVNVLEALRSEVADFASGKTDLASARARLKTFLARQGIAADDVSTSATPPAGISEEDWAARRSLENIASTRRLNLILETNAFQAHALGNRQISFDPDILQRWPYYRYIAVKDGATRSSHAALDGMILAKTDPFWQTHTPPWDFNCRCQLEDADADDAAAAGGLAKAVTQELPDGTQQSTVQPPNAPLQNIGPNPSGYTFRPGDAFTEPDWAQIPDGELKQLVKAEYDRRAAQGGAA